MVDAGASEVDRWGRSRDHPDFEQDPPLRDLLTRGLGDADWWLVDDTLCHVFISAALRVDAPKPTVAYEIMAHSDRRRCFVVIRRYSDFVTLAADMRKELFFIEEFVELLPDLPGTFLSFLTTDTDPESRFVLERKQALEGYLKELVGIGALHKSRSFRRFMLDRVYAHGWEAAPSVPRIRSGVAIDVADFKAASQRPDGCASPGPDVIQVAGTSCDERQHDDPHEKVAESDQSRQVPRISEDDLQKRRDEEERRLAGLDSAQSPRPQPQVKSSGGARVSAEVPVVISEGDPTVASQRRRAERAAEREKQQRRKRKEKARVHDAEKQNEKEKEEQSAKEKKMRRQQRKEAKAARQRAKDMLTHAAPKAAIVAPHLAQGGFTVEVQPELEPEPELELQPDQAPEKQDQNGTKSDSAPLQSHTQPQPQIGPETLTMQHTVMASHTDTDASPLPWKDAESEWEEKVDAQSGRFYYVNVRLNKSSWEKPTLDPSIVARQQARIQKHRRDGEAAAAVEEASIAVDADVNAAVEQWSMKPWPKGLRALLSTLPEIWPAAAAATTGDAPTFHVGLVDRQEFDDAAIRRVYHKAIRLVHPDKLTGAINPEDLVLVRQHVLAQKLFAVLSDAWAEFQKEVA